MMSEITANSRSRWMSRPALLNMTKPPSHNTTSTTARIRNMSNPAFFLQMSRVLREDLHPIERGRSGAALLGMKTNA
jgi:hypothetical protein